MELFSIILMLLLFLVIVAIIWKNLYFFPILFVLFLLLMTILSFQINKLNTNPEAFLISEACMKKIEREFGLVKYYQYKTKADTQKGYSVFKLNREIEMSNISIFPTNQIDQFPKEPSRSSAYWRSNIQFHVTDIDNFVSSWKLFSLYYGMALVTIWLIAAAFGRFQINNKFAVPCLLISIICLGWVFHPNRTWLVHVQHRQIQAMILKAQTDKVSQLVHGNTGIVSADDPQNVFDYELLVGGDDFFEQSFLSWDIGNYNYLYYFPKPLSDHRFFSPLSTIFKLDDHFYLIEYPFLVQNNQMIMIAFGTWLILSLIAPLLLICRSRHEGKARKNGIPVEMNCTNGIEMDQ